ncbi:ribosome biogenesis GTPase Der [Rhodovulum sp. DZ06]|uniref:ribosome biogenesis GTPase Der n=1 Tax=Rhodovulum sp. DZ06 TaxID=3425126 RepID=UPI003D328D28
MSFTLAIVGRPNVGKSTLFNRLVGKRLALVDDTPGVTRDLREGEARLGDLRFTVIDTAGLEDATDDSLPGRMRALTERAIGMADACLFVVDARTGITAQDQQLATLLRKAEATVVLGVNKAEGVQGETGVMEAWSLGIGEPIGLSAEHGEGFGDLFAALAPLVEAKEELMSEEEKAARDDKPLQIAIMGRPNAGKSTLVNAILGEERMLTGPEAGITRDSISVEVTWGEERVRIFDTAGMRKRAKVVEKLEKLSVHDGIRAVKFAEVAVVLLDSTIPFEQQDLRLADLAEREGRAVVVAVNKWDLEDDKSVRAKELREEFARLLPQLRGAPLVFISALQGKNLDKLRDAIFKVYETWNMRITTGQLNRWLIAQTEAHPPPAPSGRRIRLRYMTQVKSRPPSFAVFCQKGDDLPDSYTRFLVNGLRRDFGLDGVPIRLFYRKSDNPYEAKANKRKIH